MVNFNNSITQKKSSNLLWLGKIFSFCYYWLPPLVITAGVIIMAGDMGSVTHFRWPVVMLQYLLPTYSKKEIMSLYMTLRQVGHFMVYGALFIAYVRAWRWHIQLSRLKSIFLALGICFLISAGDEGVQALHNSRSGRFEDVLLDMSGALAAALAMFPFLRERRPQEKAGAPSEPD